MFFLLQEEKEQLIEYRSTVASLVGRAKTVVQLRPRSAERALGATTPIKAICDYRQIEVQTPWRTVHIMACCPLPVLALKGFERNNKFEKNQSIMLMYKFSAGSPLTSPLHAASSLCPALPH